MNYKKISPKQALFFKIITNNLKFDKTLNCNMRIIPGRTSINTFQKKAFASAKALEEYET